MAIPKPKDFTPEGVDPRVKLVGAAVVLWSVNWLAFKAFGSPWPYCFVTSTVGSTLSEWHDGLRAILFAAVILCLFTLRLRWAVTLVGVMVLNLMVPGIVATLFSFGHSCQPPKTAPVAVAEKAQPAPRPAQPKAKPKAKPRDCPNPHYALPDLPVEGCPEWEGSRSVW